MIDAYLLHSYHVVEAAGIYTANVTGAIPNAIGLGRVFSPPASFAAATQTVTTTVDPGSSMASLTQGAAARVIWQTSPDAVRTIATSRASDDLTFDASGLPQLRTGANTEASDTSPTTVTIPTPAAASDTKTSSG